MNPDLECTRPNGTETDIECGGTVLSFALAQVEVVVLPLAAPFQEMASLRSMWFLEVPPRPTTSGVLPSASAQSQKQPTLLQIDLS